MASQRTTQRTKSAYTEDNIKHHKGLEGCRHNPSMYLGELGDQMVFRMCKEIVDNCRDEAIAGRNNYIEVYANTKSDTYIVVDQAEGIPVGIHKQAKISTLTLILTEIHAGGKFDDKAYKTAAGTHGVGAAAVNAVSRLFEAWTCREGKWYYQAFQCGKPLAKVEQVRGVPKAVVDLLQAKPVKGTVIKFHPDQSIVKAGKDAKLDVPHACRWLSNVALLNKGVKVVYNVDGKIATRVNMVGAAKAIEVKLKQLEVEGLGKPLIYESDEIQLAVQWSTYSDDDGVSSYVSASQTADGGTHFSGFQSALAAALSEHKGARDKFTNKELFAGLVGIFNFNMSQPAFSSQIKTKLTSPVGAHIAETLLPAFKKFFSQNKVLARQILRRATEVKKLTEEHKKAMKGATAINQSAKGALLPTILASSPKATPHTRELYLVEGDSASGTAKNARDTRFQEVLRLQGKPMNAVRAKPSVLWKNTAIQNIAAALGFNPKNPSMDNLRVRRLYLLADADEDGKHINLLVLGFIYKYLPKMFDEGRVFVCDAPLFSAFVRNKRYFGKTHAECHRQLPKGTAKDVVTRAKGWGEIGAEVLCTIAFDPATRSVIKLLPPKGKALKYFESILGADTQCRKDLLGL